MWLLLIAVLGAVLGGQVNRAIYRLAWNQRSISPWSPAPDGVQRDWLDCVPIFGWWRMRRETPLHGTAFWLRPALIELGLAVGLVLLYRFEIEGGLLPIGHRPASLVDQRIQFAAHALLVLLMTVATFIDVDEKTIPDEITVPGTLLGVLIAGLAPSCLMPWWRPGPIPVTIERMLVSSPGSWPDSLSSTTGLWIAIGCILGWWYGLLPKTLWYRGGISKFLRYQLASIYRHPFSKRIHAIGLLAILGTLACWWQASPTVWPAVLSAWVGMAVAGGIVWLVRIVGTLALQQEAMGFGDVTLMGMIGAFVGWQASLVIFFFAPFAGVFVAMAQWLLTQRKDIAYGPFLCLATLVVLLGWPAVWQRWGYPLFVLGPVLPAVLGVSLALLGVTLFLIRWFRSAFGG